MANQTDPTGESGGSSGTTSDDSAREFVNSFDFSDSADLPAWLTSLEPYSDALKNIGKAVQEWGNFRLAVIGVVATWIVNGFLDLWSYVVGAVFLAVDPVVNALGFAELGLEAALGSVAASVFAFFTDLTIQIGDLVGVAGPAAPIIGSVIFAVVLVVGYYTAKLILGAIPVFDTLNQFL